MATKTRLNINMDPDLKAQASEVLGELGLDFTTAITIYFKQIVNKQKIPFDIAQEEVNADKVFKDLQKQIAAGFEAAKAGKTMTMDEAKARVATWKL